MTQAVAVGAPKGFQDLPPSVVTQIFRFVPEFPLSAVSRAFKTANEKSMDREWQRMGNPLSEIRARCMPVVGKVKEQFAKFAQPLDLKSEEYQKWEAVKKSLDHLVGMDRYSPDTDQFLNSNTLGLYTAWNRFILDDENSELAVVVSDNIRREELAIRIRGIGGDFTPARFRELREAQKRAVQELVGSEAATEVRAFRLVPHGRSYSLERFLRTEAVIDIDHALMGLNLRCAWFGNQDGAGLAFELIMLGVGGIGHLQSAPLIRLWMETHQPALDQVTHLDLTNCELTAVPPILWEGLRNLRYLDISGNPIPIFPVGLYDLLSSKATQFFLGIDPVLYHIDHTPKVTWENLRWIPFQMWLSSFTIPNPVVLWIGYLESVFGDPLINNCCGFLVYMFCPVTWLTLILMFPVLLYNALLCLVVAPLVTLIRNCLGFGLMISVNETAAALQQGGDLDGVQGGVLEELVADDPEVEGAGMGEVFADAAAEDGVLAGGV